MSQIAELKEDLERGMGVTPLEALQKYGCLSLSQRISELRADGMDFEERWEKHGNKRIKRLFLKRGNVHGCEVCKKEIQIQFRFCDRCEEVNANRPENEPGKGDAYEPGN